MTKVLVGLLFAVALVLPAAARADEPAEMDGSTQARVFAIQALAILDQGLAHEEAAEKLDQALESEDREGVDIAVIERAHDALHAENPDSAHALLHEAFPGETGHVVGVVFRPAIGAAQVAAAIAGAVVLALAGLGIAHRRRADRRYGAA